MTEDDAKTKWCPFARDSNTAGNRIRYGADADDAPAAAEFPCIASACMAWRWRTTPAQAAAGSRLSVEDGYCGLAGVPQ